MSTAEVQKIFDLLRSGDSEQVERLLAQQRRDWMFGDRTPVAEWLARSPGTAANPADAAELIYHEFLLREELGESPAFDDYLQQFPHYAAELISLCEADQLLDAAAGRGANGGARASPIGRLQNRQ